MTRVTAPYEYFADLNGDPLDNGKVYIGEFGQNPVVSQVAVYADAAMTEPLSQPIRTSAGRPVLNGSPIRIFVTGSYSIASFDKSDRLIWSELQRSEATDGADVPFDVADYAALDALTNDELALGGYVRVNSIDQMYVRVSSGGDITTTNGLQLDVIGTPFVSLAAFGVVADGATDNTTKLAAFIASLEATGAEGFVPDGDYVTGPLTTSGAVKITMAANARLILKAGSNSKIITIGAGGFTLRGGILDANRVGNTTTARCIESVEPYDDITIEFVTFQNSIQDAVKWDGGNNFKFRYNKAIDCQNGMVQAIIMRSDADGATDALGMEIIGNHAETSHTASALNHFKVRGNFKWDGSTTAATKVVKGLIFQGNTMIGAVSASGNSGAEFSRGVIEAVVTGNHFYGGNIGFSGGSFFSQSDHLEANDKGFTGTVTGNTFEAQAAEAVELTVHAVGCAVVGNTIRQGSGAMAKGILVNSPTCIDNLVSDNSINGFGTNAIHVTNGADAVTIDGNRIIGYGAGDTVIKVEGTTDRTSVRGNTVNGTGQNAVGVDCQNTTGTVVANNDFFDLTSNGVRFTGASSHVFSNMRVSNNTQDSGFTNFLATGSFTIGTGTIFEGCAGRFYSAGAGTLPDWGNWHKVTTQVSGEVLILADGEDGQILTISAENTGVGPFVVTPTNLRGATNITFNNDGDMIRLQYIKNAWHAIGGSATVT